MMLYRFIELCEEKGWDAAVDYITHNINDIAEYELKNDVYLLIEMYNMHTNTSDYQNTTDPDGGLAYSIREFAVTAIREILELQEV